MPLCNGAAELTSTNGRETRSSPVMPHSENTTRECKQHAGLFAVRMRNYHFQRRTLLLLALLQLL